MLRSFGSVTFLGLFMVGCGGGGGDSSSPPPPPPATYTVGGTVTGLAGSGLVLNSDFGGDLAVSASGSFTFGTRLPDGGKFNVSVKNQPTSSLAQNCQVANGTGTIAAANVTNVDVTCVSGYTVGGTVSGLVGSGLTLEICTPLPEHFGYVTPPYCRQQLQVGANGAFTLASAYVAGYSGLDYVSIAQQPSSPTQNCLISNAPVAIQNANDTSVTVSCTKYAYVTNAADNTVSTYSVDAATGALTVIGAPTATDVSPHAIFGLQGVPTAGDVSRYTKFGYEDLISEYKRYVFVSNEDSNDVSAFAVNNTTGALTPVSGSLFGAGTNPEAMGSDGTSLYVANAGSDNVSRYTIDTNTGVLASPGLPFGAGMNPTSIVLVPGLASLYLYVANHGGSNDISAIDVSDNTQVPRSPFPAGGNPLSLALGAGGKFLYSANPDATHPSISGFSVDPGTGALSLLSGSPFPLPVSNYIASDQTGAYLYVTSGASVVGYRIDATTGALTELQRFPIAADANAYSITIDPTNQFLYVANDGAANISGFKLDAATGALTPMKGSPFPAGNHPKFIATF